MPKEEIQFDLNQALENIRSGKPISGKTKIGSPIRQSLSPLFFRRRAEEMEAGAN